MLVLGKYLLSRGEIDHACEILGKGVLASGRNQQYIEKIVSKFLELNMPQRCDRFLNLVSVEDKVSPQFRSLDFRIFAATHDDHEVIEKAKQLIKDEIHDFEIYDRATLLLIKHGKKTLAETIAYKAIEKFPEQREHFSKRVT